jgi:hypothetical protein
VLAGGVEALEQNTLLGSAADDEAAVDLILLFPYSAIGFRLNGEQDLHG